MIDITITLSGAHATRLQAALEESMDLRAAPLEGAGPETGAPRSATVADAKEYISANLKQFVLNSEQRVASNAARVAVSVINIT